MKHDRDDAIARLVRDRLDAGSTVGACLDAETIAAWLDGTLTRTARREAESHAARCVRCQTLLATMAQTEPVAPPPRRSLVVIRWFAPALVAAAAVLVWVNVARRSPGVPVLPSMPSSADARAAAREESQAMPSGAPRPVAPAPSVPAPKPSGKNVGRVAEPSPRVLDARPDDTLESKALMDTVETRTAAGPVPAPGQPQAANVPAQPPAANEIDRKEPLEKRANPLLQRDAVMGLGAAPLIVRSADGSLWRVSNHAVGHSDDDGTTWHDQDLGSTARFLAGSSPSPNVVWFAGAAGTVAFTADGVSWQWRRLPERVDLTAITAADAQTATVTAADGRRFITHDGGLTWVPTPVQENPAAPF